MPSLNIDSNIATLTLKRPPVNALNDTWIEQMDAILDQVEVQDSISVLHLRSELKVFSAGADLGMMRRLLEKPEGRDNMIVIIRGFQRIISRLEKINIVTVAEIGGAAMGGGLELALGCDLRTVADTARLGLPETRLGLIPAAGGTQRLTRICGEATARRLILGGEVIDGQEAADLGLAQWVFPAGQLQAGTCKIVQKLGGLPRDALISAKACVAAALDTSTNGYELELTETRKLHDVTETRELIKNFLEKK